jgi:hypothetical protein
MADDRITRKLDVSFFVLNKKFKGLKRDRLEEEVEKGLRELLGADAMEKTPKMPDDDFIPVLNDAVELARKNYVMTLPRKRGKPA